MKLKVSVIGLGFVGLTLTAFLGSKKIKVTGIDSDENKIKLIQESKPPFFEPNLKSFLKKAIKSGCSFETKITNETALCDFIFVTVGTPINKNGKIDLKFVKSVTNSLEKNLGRVNSKPTIVIKSTVVPGTTINVIKPILERNSLVESVDFDLLTNPEFLKEGSAIYDTIKPHAIVIGGSIKKSMKKLVDFYKKIYPKTIPYIETNNSTAEMIKYANNSFLATKISFINSLANICQKIDGVNVDHVARVMGMDPRISEQFLKAGPGYGGSCFPKDLQALISYSNQIGYNPTLLNAVRTTNNNQVKTVLNIIKHNIPRLNGLKIGILGLSFKENTDDIRESVSINLIKQLLKQKCKIFVHDPIALKNTSKVFKNKISYCKNFKEVLPKTECIVILTPWKIYESINESELLKMKNSLVIDTRRILHINNKKIKYIGLGIGN